MIKLFVNRFEDLLYLGKVANPTCMRINFTLQENGDSERVAMQPATFMSVGYVRQTMCGLERKLFEYFHWSIRKVKFFSCILPVCIQSVAVKQENRKTGKQETGLCCGSL